MGAVELTPRSKELFIEYAKDSPNWSGMPLVGGNVSDTKEDRGNLTQLKKQGLITTFKEEGYIWMTFTPVGVKYARYFKIGMPNYDSEGKLR